MPKVLHSDQAQANKARILVKTQPRVNVLNLAPLETERGRAGTRDTRKQIVEARAVHPRPPCTSSAVLGSVKQTC